MTIQIAPAVDADREGILEFNHRLAAHADGGGYSLPESPWSLGVAQDAGAPVWHEIFVARDESGVVRGGYALKRELIITDRGTSEIWNYQIPLSEGIIDRKYATLGIRLLQDAVNRHQRLYCLGMGSRQRPLPRLLKRFSWSVEEVPFRFRIVRANNFLKNIAFLRTSPWRSFVLDCARLFGLGTLAVAARNMLLRSRRPEYPDGFTAHDVHIFGEEADAVFAGTATEYGSLIDRSSASLNVRFPVTDRRLMRVVFHVYDRPIGWLVLTRNDLQQHKQFGNMRLGCLVDGLCDPQHTSALVRYAVDRLTQERVDLIVTNQSHEAWLNALRHNGFMHGPSNFIFARSPELAACTASMEQCHVNRGDGDGPINL